MHEQLAEFEAAEHVEVRSPMRVRACVSCARV
jgi:hypothetical protein